jgi:formate/nitrite transporter FocA (FNT family)
MSYLMGQFWPDDAPVERCAANNLIGTGIAAWAFEYMPIFDEHTRDAFVKIGMDVMKNTPMEMFSNAIISGWIIATMVWMFPLRVLRKSWLLF